LGCYYGFEKRANEVATNRINTFRYANRRSPRRARKECKLLAAKTFAYANEPFAYANPPRGDVSPLLPARKRRFSGYGLFRRGFYRISLDNQLNFVHSLPPYVEQAEATYTDFGAI
jgi:hypothetical protein